VRHGAELSPRSVDACTWLYGFQTLSLPALRKEPELHEVRRERYASSKDCIYDYVPSREELSTSN
jgi:hypothetical protein